MTQNPFNMELPFNSANVYNVNHETNLNELQLFGKHTQKHNSALP